MAAILGSTDIGPFCCCRKFHWTVCIGEDDTSCHLSRPSCDGLKSLQDVPKSTLWPGRKFYLFIYFCLFRATPAAYGVSQTRGQIEAIASALHQSHSNTRSSHVWIYTTVHGNARSLTHSVRPGVEPVSSWMIVRFVPTEPRWELYISFFLFFFFFFCLFAFSRATPAARALTGAVATGVHQSHSNAGSKPHLQTTPQLMAMPNP